MKEKLNFLNPQDVEALKAEYEVLTFPNDFDLVYENQIPTAGIALIQGQIELIKRSRIHQLINSCCLLGVEHILQHRPTRLGLRIKSNSQIILLGKSEIMSLLKNQNSKVFNLIKGLNIKE